MTYEKYTFEAFSVKNIAPFILARGIITNEPAKSTVNVKITCDMGGSN